MDYTLAKMRDSQIISKKSFFTRLSIFMVAMFFVAGNFQYLPYFKDFPDLTIISAIFPILFFLYLFLSKFTIPKSLIWFAFIFITLLPSLSFTTFNTYAIQKLTVFSSVLILAVLFSSLIKTKEDLHLFFKYLSVVGFLLIICTLPYMLGGLQTRLTLNGSNPIWLSRAVGISAIWIIILTLHKKIKVYQMLLFVIPTIFIMLGTGSRGPLLALIVCVTFVYIFSRSKRIISKLAGLVSLFIMVLIIWNISKLFLPDSVVQKVSGLISGDLGTSGQARIELFSVALNLFKQNPFGVGFGGYSNYTFLPYPHNIFLESFAEGGLFFGLALSIFILVAFIICFKLARRIPSPEFDALLAVMIFSFINSQVSGDLTSPKEMYFVIGVVINFYYVYYKSSLKADAKLS